MIMIKNDSGSKKKSNGNKNNKYRYKANLMVLFCLICVLFASFFIVVIVAGSALSFYGNAAVILLFILLLVIICIIFWKTVYTPVSKIETVLNTIFSRKALLKFKDPIDRPKNKNLYNLDMISQELQDLIKSGYSAEIMKNQAELNALQSQINPHFLYNTLESIRGQAIVHKVRDIEVMTKALADMFRYIISKKSAFISFREELVNVDNYLKIQQFRFNNKFIIEKEIDEDMLDNQIPKLLIQPIVENALQHGLEMKRTKGRIAIKAYCTQDRFIVNIEDDGLGMNIDKLRALNEALAANRFLEGERSGSGGSIGLLNVNERIKMSFGNECGIKIYSAENVGTNVEITLKPSKKKETDE